MTPKAPDVRSREDELTVEATRAAQAGAADTEIALGSLAGKPAESPADPSAAGSVEGALAEAAVLASENEQEDQETENATEEAARGGWSLSAEGGFAALLESVLVGEPPVGDGVDRVYRRAETLRRRRLRRVVASGAFAALLVAAVGYALTAAVIPGVRDTRTAAPVVAGPTPNVDPLLTALAPVVRARGLRAVPREPARGEGWRQYSVVDRKSGRPRGLIEISAYAAPDGICFPVGGDPKACARAMHAGDNVEYARYSDDRDPDWQVHQAIARRLSDGRVIAVMATGERGTGDAGAGRPPLSVAETAELAVAVPVMSAFDSSERCNGPDPACPVLKVPVPLER